MEHIVPQFLGGAFAPDIFKTRSVCKSCNSNLGLFVDAAIEKTWYISNNLQLIAMPFFNKDNPRGMPLACMGILQIDAIYLLPSEVCELWLGPLGEQIFLIRPADPRLSHYVGGNPIKNKREGSRAYFVCSERSASSPELFFYTFKDAFKHKSIKKLLCTGCAKTLHDSMGFAEPDDLDTRRIQYFQNLTTTEPMRNVTSQIKIDVDYRFLSKIAIGISFILLGNNIQTGDYADALYSALTSMEDATRTPIIANPIFNEKTKGSLIDVLSFPSSVTIAVIQSSGGIYTNISIGTAVNFGVLCVPSELCDENCKNILGDGIVLVLNKYAQKGISLNYIDFIAHKTSATIHPGLAEWEAICKPPAV